MDGALKQSSSKLWIYLCTSGYLCINSNFSEFLNMLQIYILKEVYHFRSTKIWSDHSAGVNIICINMCLTVEWQILKWLYMCAMVHYMWQVPNGTGQVSSGNSALFFGMRYESYKPKCSGSTAHDYLFYSSQAFCTRYS